jgi:hypothetical protein
MDSQMGLRFHQGGHGAIAVLLYPLHSNYPLRPRFTVSTEQGVVIVPTRHLFLKALSGLSKQGTMFRNS